MHAMLHQILVALLVEQCLRLGLISRHHLLVRHIGGAPQVGVLLPIGRAVLEELGHGERLDIPAAARPALVETGTWWRGPHLLRRHMRPAWLELRTAAIRKVSLRASARGRGAGR